MRIGLVDLDTSHPENWIPIERELGHDIVGVWDAGAVHPHGYAEAFTQKYGIPHVFASLEDMAASVDCAIIHSCNWDTHVAKARPFIEAGRSVLVDKPLAGNLRDLHQLLAWAREGHRITGGSSLRFCIETRAWLSRPVAERGQPHTVLCGCAVDEFNYGVHAYSMLSGIMGPGVASVQHLGAGVQRRVRVNWHDGRMGLVVVGAAGGWMPFYATIVTEKAPFQYQADTAKLYRAILDTVLPYLAGETDTPPLPFEDLAEPELCALAARQSWLRGNCEVKLAELSENDPGYDGSSFAEEYRQAKYPASART